MKEIPAGDTSPTRQHSSTDFTKVIFSERSGPKQFSLDDHLTTFQTERFSESAAEFPYRQSEQEIPLTKHYEVGRALRSIRSLDDMNYALQQSIMRDEDRIEMGTLVEKTRSRVEEVKQEVVQVKKSLVQVDAQYQLARTDCQRHCQKFKLTLHEEGRLRECADTKYNNAKKKYDNAKTIYDNLSPESQRSHTSKPEKTASQEDYARTLDILRTREKFFDIKIGGLTVQKTNLENCRKSLNDKGSKLDIQKSGEEKQILLTKDTSRKLNTKINNLENRIKMFNKNKTDWEGSLSQMQAKLAQVEGQLKDLKKAEEDIKSLQEQIDPLKKEISKEGKDLDKSRQHVDNLSKLLDEKGKKAEEITAAQEKKKLFISDLEHPEKILHLSHPDFINIARSSEDESVWSNARDAKVAARKIDVLETFAKADCFDVQTSKYIEKLSKQTINKIRLDELQHSASLPAGYKDILGKIDSYKANEEGEEYAKIINHADYLSKEEDLKRMKRAPTFFIKNEEDYSKLQGEANSYQQKFIKITKRMNSTLSDFTKSRNSGGKETAKDAKKFISDYYEQQKIYAEFDKKQHSMEKYLSSLINAENTKIGLRRIYTEIGTIFEKAVLSTPNSKTDLKRMEVINAKKAYLRKLETEFEDTNKIISLFEARKAEEGKKITSSENSLGEHNTRLSSIEQEIIEHQNRSSQYQKTKKELENNITNTENKLKGENYSQDSLKKLEDELGELRQEETMVTTRIDEDEKSVATLVHQLQEIQGEKEKSREEQERVSTELDSATAFLNNIRIQQKALDILHENYNIMQKAFDDREDVKKSVEIKSQVEEQKKNIEIQIQALEIKLEAARKKFRILQFS